MKILKIFISTILFLLFAGSIFANEQIAVIPYRIENPGKNFPISTGVEYSKLFAVGSAVKQNFELYPIYNLQKDLKKFGINAQVSLSAENLNLLCDTRFIDYIISGTITKTSSGYIAKSILYSRKNRKVINRSSVSARSIESLAEKDINELYKYLVSSPKSISNKQQSIQLAIIIDSSIRTSYEMNNIKNSIKSIYSDIKNQSPDSEIFISNTPSKIRSFKKITNFSNLSNQLKSLRNSGKISDNDYISSLNNAINNIRWNYKKEKHILIITNSSIKRSAAVYRIPIKAQNKKISISHILLGNINKDANTLYSSISVKTNGFVKDVAYHQTIYDRSGNDLHLYYERSRLFKANTLPPSWKKGILVYQSKNRDYNIKVPEFVQEIYTNSGSINPYDIISFYKKSSTSIIVNSKKVETNLNYLMDYYRSSFINLNKSAPIARVMLSQFKTSIWIDVYNQNDLDYFKKMQNQNRSFIIGFQVTKNDSTAYNFSPGSKYYLNFDLDQVPKNLLMNLDNLIKNLTYYSNNGFLSPPLIFCNLKVERINSIKEINDIRN